MVLCLDSILAQTFRDFELILVDDGSPDGCPAICDDYGQKDSRVRVVHQENRGLSGARNTGLDIAEGSYIFLVDSDDVLLTDRCLEILHDIAQWSDAEIVHCGSSFFQDGEGTPAWDGWDGRLAFFTGEYLCAHLQNTSPYPYAAAFAKLYKREVFDRLRYPEGRLAEDQFLAHRIYYPCSRVALVCSRMYGYRRRGSGIMGSSGRARLYVDVQDAFQDRMAYFHSLGKEQLTEQARAWSAYWKACYLLAAAEDGSWKDIPEQDRISGQEAEELIRRYHGERILEQKLSRIPAQVCKDLGLTIKD